MARTLKALLALAFAAAGLFGASGVAAAQTPDDCYPIPEDGCDVGSDDDGTDDDGTDDGGECEGPDDGVDDGVGGADDGDDDGVGGADDGDDDGGVGGADDGSDDGTEVGGVGEEAPSCDDGTEVGGTGTDVAGGDIDVEPAVETEVLANVLARTGLSATGLISVAVAGLAAGTVLLLGARRRRGPTV